MTSWLTAAEYLLRTTGPASAGRGGPVGPWLLKTLSGQIYTQRDRQWTDTLCEDTCMLPYLHGLYSTALAATGFCLHWLVCLRWVSSPKCSYGTLGVIAHMYAAIIIRSLISPCARSLCTTYIHICWRVCVERWMHVSVAGDEIFLILWRSSCFCRPVPGRHFDADGRPNANSLSFGLGCAVVIGFKIQIAPHWSCFLWSVRCRAHTGSQWFFWWAATIHPRRA